MAKSYWNPKERFVLIKRRRRTEEKLWTKVSTLGLITGTSPIEKLRRHLIYGHRLICMQVKKLSNVTAVQLDISSDAKEAGRWPSMLCTFAFPINIVIVERVLMQDKVAVSLLMRKSCWLETLSRHYEIVLCSNKTCSEAALNTLKEEKRKSAESYGQQDSCSNFNITKSSCNFDFISTYRKIKARKFLPKFRLTSNLPPTVDRYHCLVIRTTSRLSCLCSHLKLVWRFLFTQSTNVFLQKMNRLDFHFIFAFSNFVCWRFPRVWSSAIQDRFWNSSRRFPVERTSVWK